MRYAVIIYPNVCLCTGGKYFNNDARRLNEISSTTISRIATNSDIGMEVAFLGNTYLYVGIISAAWTTTQ